jgi:hypothetical protein
VKRKPARKALNGSDGIIASAANPAPTDESTTASKKAIAAKLKPAAPDKVDKATQPPPRSSRAASEKHSGKLVCRYCGSDDLAPSFIKRRDARYRACFKQRYGSTAKDKKVTCSRKANVAR